jgi:pimeloyl-ACP methyl ester carboxylesterase
VSKDFVCNPALEGLMTFLDLGGDTAIFYQYAKPAAGKRTFVFVNSMSASTAMWEAAIAPALRSAGYGTLSFDYRGQGQTKFGTHATLEPAEIIGDDGRVVAYAAPAAANSRGSIDWRALCHAGRSGVYPCGRNGADQHPPQA